MPLYQYDSYSKRGARIKGVVDASSLQAAKEILRGQGLMPVEIKEVTPETTTFSLSSLFERKVDIRTKVLFTRQLAVLLRSGVPLLQSLELLSEQFVGRFKRVLVDIKDGVKSGESFASQLAKYPKVFPKIYVQLVKAGEASGKLDVILDRLTSYLEKEEETRKVIKKALSYPLTVLFFAVLVVIGLLAVLVPSLKDIFGKLGKELPASTQFLIDASNFLIESFWFIIIGGGILIFSFLYWKSTEKGSYQFDEFILKVPLFSYFSKLKAVVQFSKTLGMLLSSGVNLAEALDIVCNIVDNHVLSYKLKEARDQIIKEGKIAKYLKKTEIFPPMASYMISTGEQSGKLAEMLLSVGKDYEEELLLETSRFTSKIGPLTTVVMGVIVGFILVSVFLPIAEMGDIAGV